MDYSLNALLASLAAIAVVLAFEDWAYLKSKSKLHRAVITGIGVFLVVLLLNVPIAYW
jgi:hypothetical protein